jgi:O-antigen ligase
MTEVQNDTVVSETAQANRIGFGLLAAFLLLLPYDFFYSQFALAGFAAFTVIQLRLKRLKQLLALPVLLPGALYLLNVAGLLYSPDTKEALNIAGRQAALVILPVLLVLNAPLVAQYKQQLLNVFAAGIVLAILYLLAHAAKVMYYYHLPLRSFFSPAFMNHNFSKPIDIHATYLSMYAALALVITVVGFAAKKTALARYVSIAAMLVLAGGLLQLSSRAVLVAVLMVVLVVFPLLLVPAVKRQRYLLFAGSATLLLGVLFFSIDAFKTRYIIDLKIDLAGQRVKNELVESRMERWKAALEIVQQAPLVGHGSGAEQPLLQDKYFEKKMYGSFLNDFNAHNQYLYFLICFGVAGLLVYLFVLYRAAAMAWQQRDTVFAAFAVLMVVVSVSENVLNLNKGVFFFSFFLPLFIIAGRAGEATRQSINTFDL